MSLLDLLSAFASPELTASERTTLRALVSSERSRAQQQADAPWESGVVAQRPKTREERLQERVEDLELALKVLADILAERGLLERGSLPARVAQMKRDVEEQEESRAALEAERTQQQRKEAEDAPVTCAGCGTVVRTQDSFVSSRGPLCSTCHHEME
jgi:hypothetical protein